MEKPGSGLIVVHGDYFNSDTRLILSILDIAGVKYQFKLVDQFLKQN